MSHGTGVEAEERLSNGRVLIVDDEPAVLDIFKEVLSLKSPSVSLGFTNGDPSRTPTVVKLDVITCPSGIEAIEVVGELLSRGENVCGGFFDLTLGGEVNGVDTIARLREMDPRILCTVMTGHNKKELTEVERTFRGHDDEWDYMVKPLFSLEIVQKTRNMVSSWNLRAQKDQQARKIEQQQEFILKQLHEIENANRELVRVKGHLEEMVTARTSQLEHKTRELEELHRFREDMLHIISHELRKPLSIMNSTIYLMKRPEVKGEKLKEYLMLVERSSDDIEGYIERMLKAYSLEGQPLEVQLKETDPLKIMEGSVNDNLPLSGRYGQELSMGNVDQLPLITTDPRLLREILDNIISNAIKYTPDGGRIVMEGEKDGSGIRISVTDTGIGMDPERIKYVFERFFIVKDARLPRNTTRTGVGLYTVKRYLEVLGGSVEFESTLGKGSRVSIVLPLTGGD